MKQNVFNDICSKIIYASFRRKLQRMLTEHLSGLVEDTGIPSDEAIAFLKVIVPTALQEVLTSLELQKLAQATTGAAPESVPDEPPYVHPPTAQASSESKGVPDAIDAIFRELEEAGTTIVEALQRSADALTPTLATRQRIEAFGAKVQGGVDSFLSKFHQPSDEDKPQVDDRAQPGDKPSSPPTDPTVN